MKKAIVYSAGRLAKRLLPEMAKEYEILFAVDDDGNKRGALLDGIEIKSPERLSDTEYDAVIIASAIRHDEIYDRLTGEYGLDARQTVSKFAKSETLARIAYMRRFAEECRLRGIEGSVAEIGVYRGDFAAEINRRFPDRTLYLFDTFEGFSEADLLCEDEADAVIGDFSNTGVELVVKKLPHPEKAVVKKGRFPETFDLRDERFCFVNLDVDLYAPTKAGLNIFFPQMTKTGRGGVILIHDYFSEKYPGVKAAVDEFHRENSDKAELFGIEDHCSIGVRRAGIRDRIVSTKL
jgi:hypothetical protein